MLDKTFNAHIIKDDHKGGWTYLIWPDSVAFFGTRKPVKVKGTIDGYIFQTTFLPWGDGAAAAKAKFEPEWSVWFAERFPMGY